MLHLYPQLVRHIISLPGEAVPLLLEVEASFVLILSCDDIFSNKLENIFISFLDYNKSNLPIVKVLVNSITAQLLAVSQVPQVRKYVNGNEVYRHRGTMTYSSILSLFSLPT